jgi:transcriptional regulator of acetoin/glycerol metabolism
VTDWRAQLDGALACHDGNKSAAARSLGISRKTLHEELRRRRA